MLSNRKLKIVISLLTAAVLVLLLQTAIREQEWRGFWVSGFHVLLTAVCSFFLLRKPSSLHENTESK